MEGWLHFVRSDGFGLHKRYFVLENNVLKCYKTLPGTNAEDPMQSAVADSCIRATDNGRDSLLGNLGARSSEEAERWIRSLTVAALKEWPDKEETVVACSKRSWGFFLLEGNVIEDLHGDTDIIQKKLCTDWLPWGIKERVLLLQLWGYRGIKERVLLLQPYWRREDDGTYGESAREISLLHSGKEHLRLELQSSGENNTNEDSVEETNTSPYGHAMTRDSILQLNEAADEFVDVLNEPQLAQTETLWSPNGNMQTQSLVQDQCDPKLSTAASFVRKLQDIVVQKRGSNLQEKLIRDSPLCIYGATLTIDPTRTVISSCSEADPSTFLIRGESYLHDRQKIKPESTLMNLVGADWLKSDKREDDLGSQPGGIVQKYAHHAGREFFFIVNIQVPGSTTHSLAFYYMMDAPLESVPLLENFVKGDDAFRNTRFKLIPYISKGSWIVKQAVGKKACLVGQALHINYFQGSNYLELGIDIGSSTVARGVTGLVLGYLNNLVIELAFVIQGNTQKELPELLVGTCRINHLDPSKTVLVKP